MRKEITKKGYRYLIYFLIAIGIIGVTIFYTMGTMSGFNSTNANFLGLSEMIIGFAVGLVIAYTFKIKDYKY